LSSDGNHVSKDVFDLFKEYTDEKFNVLHECDQRIEGKLDTLIEKLEATEQKKQDRKFGTREKVIIAGVATVFGAVSSFVIHLVKGG
jgi:hypothetical protein